jgi:Mycotoxin biosynthesis protein UstYa
MKLRIVGGGYIRVRNPRQYNMPSSQPVEDDEEESTEQYGISVAHQLHCLAMLRNVMLAYERHEVSPHARSGHVYHCFDYSEYTISCALAFSSREAVRQAILCHGDTTLEWARYGPGPKHDQHSQISHADGGDSMAKPDGSAYHWYVSGDDSIHQCRDWGVIKDFLVANRGNNKTGAVVA